MVKLIISELLVIEKTIKHDLINGKMDQDTRLKKVVALDKIGEAINQLDAIAK